jgi:hypothetical protein
MDNVNDLKIIPLEVTHKRKNETAISILIKDLDTSSRLQDEVSRGVFLKLSEILEKHYLKKERDAMIDFAFYFYADLSRKMGVPENLISENLTHAENYFDEKFPSKAKNV